MRRILAFSDLMQLNLGVLLPLASDRGGYRTVSRVFPHLSCAVWSGRSLEKTLENKPAPVPTIKFGSVQINSEF